MSIQKNKLTVTLVDTTTYDRLRPKCDLRSHGIVLRSYDKSCVFLVVVGSRSIKIDRTQVFDHVQKFHCDLSGHRWPCVFSSRAIDVLQVLGGHTLSWVIVGMSSY